MTEKPALKSVTETDLYQSFQDTWARLFKNSSTPGNREAYDFLVNNSSKVYYDLKDTIEKNLLNIDFSSIETVQSWLMQNTTGFTGLDEEVKIIKNYYMEGKSLNEIAKEKKKTTNQIIDLKESALRKLRNPKRARNFRPFFDDIDKTIINK